MYDEDLENARQLCSLAKEAEISAVIASDISIIEFAGTIDLEVHISTHVNISNMEAVWIYSRFADVVVLARELSLEQVKCICERVKRENICGPSGNLLKIETFIHGTMCVYDRRLLNEGNDFHLSTTFRTFEKYSTLLSSVS